MQRGIRDGEETNETSAGKDETGEKVDQCCGRGPKVDWNAGNDTGREVMTDDVQEKSREPKLREKIKIGRERSYKLDWG
jgi:hypothetical protein